MDRYYSSEIKPDMAGKEVRILGWVHDVRDLGGIKFILLRDTKGVVQITITKNASDTIKQIADFLTKESVIEVKGHIKGFKSAPNGFEIIPSSIGIISASASPVPIDVVGKVKANLDTYLNNRSLSLRILKYHSVFRIQSKIVEFMEDYLRKNDYSQVFTPCLMGLSSEGGSDVFPVLYFNRDVYLRQDPQLHRQLTILGGFDKIFDVGPSWRAEESHTVRHLCEHRGCAVELAFINDEKDTMVEEENLIGHTFKNLKDSCEDELKTLNIELEIPKKPFPELRFPTIYEILREMGKEIEYGEDYDRESEKLLGKYVREKYKSDFFFANRFPFKEKPFYVMRVDNDPQWARSVDLIYKGVEISSGGQREHRYEKIIEQINEKKMSPENLEWFTEPFKFGAPPHGGFNIGIERLTYLMLDLENIREATLFPRDVERTVP